MLIIRYVLVTKYGVKSKPEIFVCSIRVSVRIGFFNFQFLVIVFGSFMSRVRSTLFCPYFSPKAIARMMTRRPRGRFHDTY